MVGSDNQDDRPKYDQVENIDECLLYKRQVQNKLPIRKHKCRCRLKKQNVDKNTNDYWNICHIELNHDTFAVEL